MLSYAWRCLNSRAALAGISVLLALIAAVPGILVATALAPAALGLLLSGDPAVGVVLLPPLLASGASSLPAWAAVATALALGCTVWTRLYAAAVWLSDEKKAPDLKAAWRETRRRWRRVVTLYAQAYGVVLCVAVALFFAVAMATEAPVPFSPLVLAAAALVLLARTLVRILLTLAIRAAIFEGHPSRHAWRRARMLARSRRRDVAAAWMVLVAIGAVVWMGGRLISPILQDTSLSYPATSSYAFAREFAHLVIAVPLEAFLIALALGVWTALYLDVPEFHETLQGRSERRARERRTHPWAARAFAALLAITIFANAIPAAIDAAWERAEGLRLAAIGEREITPVDALRPDDVGTPSSSTSYRVSASLVEDRLDWTTRILYRNRTGETLENMAVHVYPAAFTRPVEEIPLARDLVAADPVGVLRRETQPGTFMVQAVRVNGKPAEFSRDETVMLVNLSRPLQDGHTAVIEITLTARLPQWPERFGVWDETTLLGNWIPVVAMREDGSWRLDPYGDIGDPFFAEVADYLVELRTADTQMVVGTGILTRVRDTGQGSVWRFVASSSRDAAFAVGPLRGLEQRVGSVVVRSWYSGDDRDLGATNLDAARSAVAYYQSHFGDLPHDEIDVVSTRGFLGGMEYPGVVFISAASTAIEDVPLLPDLLDHAGFEDAASRYVVGHEVAHQWWYASVGSDQVREPWLDEAFAETSARLWLRARDGREREWHMINLAATASPKAVLATSVNDYSSNATYSQSVYVTGSEVLLALKERVGTRTFMEILRTWHQRQRLSIGTIDQFIDTAREVAGAEAAHFLEGYR